MDDADRAPTPSGWFPNPADAGQERWWDGRAWTEKVRRRGVHGASSRDDGSTGQRVPAQFPRKALNSLGSATDQPAQEPVRVPAGRSVHPPYPAMMVALLVLGLLALLAGVILLFLPPVTVTAPGLYDEPIVNIPALVLKDSWGVALTAAGTALLVGALVIRSTGYWLKWLIERGQGPTS